MKGLGQKRTFTLILKYKICFLKMGVHSFSKISIPLQNRKCNILFGSILTSLALTWNDLTPPRTNLCCHRRTRRKWTLGKRPRINVLPARFDALTRGGIVEMTRRTLWDQLRFPWLHASLLDSSSVTSLRRKRGNGFGHPSSLI